VACSGRKYPFATSAVESLYNGLGWLKLAVAPSTAGFGGSLLAVGGSGDRALFGHIFFVGPSPAFLRRLDASWRWMFFLALELFFLAGGFVAPHAAERIIANAVTKPRTDGSSSFYCTSSTTKREVGNRIQT